MFIRKSQYRKYKEHFLKEPKAYHEVPLRAYTPGMLRVSASVYREKALAGENTADNIVTSIRMLKRAIVCERLLEA